MNHRAQGRPRHHRGVSSEPGVYFLGLPWQSRRGSSFIWGVWHAPMFFIPIATFIDADTLSPFTVTVFLLRTIGLSVIYTWVMAHTRGSVLLAVLLHAADNAGMAFIVFPELTDMAQRDVIMWTTIPILIAAALVVAVFGPRTLAGRGGGVQASPAA